MTVSTDPETLSKLSLEELEKQLQTSTQGLSTKEASDRLLRPPHSSLFRFTGFSQKYQTNHGTGNDYDSCSHGLQFRATST